MKTGRRASAFLGIALAMMAAGLAATPVAAAETCESLRWTTLGTAGGPVPTVERGEPANLLRAGDMAILVDAGDGTANGLGRAGLQVGAVRTVFISHLHWDHAGGLGAVVGLRWMNEYPDPQTIYGPPGTREVVDGIIASLQAPSRIGFGLGEAPRPPADTVKVVELRGGDTVSVGGLSVRAAENTHYDGAAVDGGDTRSLSYRFEFGGRSITYTGDTGPSPAVAELAAGSDLLVSEVISLEPLLAFLQRTRPDMPERTASDMRRHLSAHHLPPEAVGALASQAQVGRVVLTHYAMPGRLEDNAPSLLAGLRQDYSGPADLAHDMQTFEIGCPAAKEELAQ